MNVTGQSRHEFYVSFVFSYIYKRKQVFVKFIILIYSINIAYISGPSYIKSVVRASA